MTNGNSGGDPQPTPSPVAIPPTPRQLRLQAQARVRGGLTLRGIQAFEKLSKEEQEARLKAELARAGLKARQEQTKREQEAEARRTEQLELAAKAAKARVQEVQFVSEQEARRAQAALAEFEGKKQPTFATSLEEVIEKQQKAGIPQKTIVTETFKGVGTLRPTRKPTTGIFKRREGDIFKGTLADFVAETGSRVSLKDIEKSGALIKPKTGETGAEFLQRLRQTTSQFPVQTFLLEREDKGEKIVRKKPRMDFGSPLTVSTLKDLGKKIREGQKEVAKEIEPIVDLEKIAEEVKEFPGELVESVRKEGGILEFRERVGEEAVDILKFLGKGGLKTLSIGQPAPTEGKPLFDIPKALGFDFDEKEFFRPKGGVLQQPETIGFLTVAGTGLGLSLAPRLIPLAETVFIGKAGAEFVAEPSPATLAETGLLVSGSLISRGIARVKGDAVTPEGNVELIGTRTFKSGENTVTVQKGRFTSRSGNEVRFDERTIVNPEGVGTFVTRFRSPKGKLLKEIRGNVESTFDIAPKLGKEGLPIEDTFEFVSRIKATSPQIKPIEQVQTGEIRLGKRRMLKTRGQLLGSITEAKEIFKVDKTKTVADVVRISEKVEGSAGILESQIRTGKTNVKEFDIRVEAIKRGAKIAALLPVSGVVGAPSTFRSNFQGGLREFDTTLSRFREIKAPVVREEIFPSGLLKKSPVISERLVTRPRVTAELKGVTLVSDKELARAEIGIEALTDEEVEAQIESITESIFGEEPLISEQAISRARVRSIVEARPQAEVQPRTRAATLVESVTDVGFDTRFIGGISAGRTTGEDIIIPEEPRLRTGIFFGLPDLPEPKARVVNQEPYDIRVKKKGKLTTVNKRPVTLRTGLDRGAELVDKSLARTFDVVKSKKKQKPISQPTGYFRRNLDKFRDFSVNRKGVRTGKLPPNTYIEKRQFGLDMKGETQSIQAALRKARVKAPRIF